MRAEITVRRKKEEPRWMLYTKKADFQEISARFGIDPVTARILRNRDVVGDREMERYLYGTVKDLHSPHKLKDIDYAAGLIRQKIGQGKRIRIVGDYDIDGVCATYLLIRGLRRCGANVDHQIPERIRDGYGINESIIRKAAADGVDTIITCDNGISAYDQLQLARELGLTVIVTDHHEVPKDTEGKEKLPPASAVINPHQESCRYPYKDICGAVVAYKLIQVLYENFGIREAEWAAMLEFAAIATVGDVMPLKDENRILVKHGLKQMPNTRSVGLRCLVEACNLDIYHLTAYHIGFVIGPCLNASGRLQTAELALELLLCEEEESARKMAARLQQLNEERKEMTQKGVDQALAQVEERYAEDKVLVIYLPECHESIAGIIAGRVREAWNRPSMVLTRGEGCVKGSGRSIRAYSMYQKLCEVQDLLLKFGGHPMAAGFSLEEKDIDEFRRRLNEQSGLTSKDFIPEIWIDVAMPFEYISERLIQELSLLEPFGQGNEKPQFAQRRLRIRDVRVLGKLHNAVRLSLVTESGFVMEGILFAEGDRFLEELGNKKIMDIIYYPEINEYNGNRSLQVVVKEYRLHGGEQEET